jgi:hypothetical protein
MHRKTHHLTATTPCPHTGHPCQPGFDLVTRLGRAIALASGVLPDEFSLSGTAKPQVGCTRSCVLGWHASAQGVRSFGDIPPDCDIEALAERRADLSGRPIGFGGAVVRSEAVPQRPT